MYQCSICGIDIRDHKDDTCPVELISHYIKFFLSGEMSEYDFVFSLEFMLLVLETD